MVGGKRVETVIAVLHHSCEFCLGIGRKPSVSRCIALLILVTLAVAPAAPAYSAAKAPCSPCHEQIQGSWVGSPHERVGRSLPKGFPCQECHTAGLLHPTAVTPANSADRCGRCHWAGSPARTKKGAIVSPSTLEREAWQKSKHSQAKLGCTACHTAHRYAEGADQLLLRQAGDALCRGCHPQPRHKLASPEAIAKEPCVGCHDPHGGEEPLLEGRSGGGKADLRNKVVHRPVAEGKCTACHTAHIVSFGSAPPDEDELDEEPGTAPPGGQPFKGLLLAPGRTFCYLCHGAFQERFKASGHAKIVRFRRGEEQSPCLGCHLPHASRYRKLTRYDGNQLCLACHPGYAPHHFLARGGVKQSQLQCVKCHNPHGTGNRRLLVQNDICKLCHQM